MAAEGGPYIVSDNNAISVSNVIGDTVAWVDGKYTALGKLAEESPVVRAVSAMEARVTQRPVWVETGTTNTGWDTLENRANRMFPLPMLSA